MKSIVSSRVVFILIILFVSAAMCTSCASGPKGGVKHCTGKKTARTKAMHRMAPTMAR